MNQPQPNPALATEDSELAGLISLFGNTETIAQTNGQAQDLSAEDFVGSPGAGTGDPIGEYLPMLDESFSASGSGSAVLMAQVSGATDVVSDIGEPDLSFTLAGFDTGPMPSTTTEPPLMPPDNTDASDVDTGIDWASDELGFDFDTDMLLRDVAPVGSLESGNGLFSSIQLGRNSEIGNTLSDGRSSAVPGRLLQEPVDGAGTDGSLNFGISAQAGAWVIGLGVELGVSVPTSFDDFCLYFGTNAIAGPQLVASAGLSSGYSNVAPTTGMSESYGATVFGGSGVIGGGQVTFTGHDSLEAVTQATGGRIQLGAGGGAGYVQNNTYMWCVER